MNKPDERRVNSTIRQEHAGMRLIDYLCRRFTYWQEDNWRAALASGLCLLDGEKVLPEQIVSEGNSVSLDVSGIPEPDVDKSFSIAYEDDDLLVINKSGDLPVHPGGPFFKNTLWYLLKQERENLHIVNRLDRETSGLVLLAKNPQAASRLGKQWERRTVEKDYFVMVEGTFPQEGIVARGWLCKDEESNIRKKQKFVYDQPENGTTSDAEFKFVAEANGMSLVACALKTGRMHQIRVSLCSLGFPVIGDKIYGFDDEVFLRFINKTMTEEDHQKLRLQRQALHCYRMAIQHPTTNELIEFKAPLASDMQGLCQENGLAMPF